MALGRGPDVTFAVTGVRGVHLSVGWTEVSVLAAVVIIQGV